ncbi:MAG: cobalamin B12-binding domain-containing protein, partial [Candidatus Omnitrophica bacterium]|nr:cobalamin B12-binding domain-containing protein [Candidatus Omnitrophota bacterium]
MKILLIKPFWPYPYGKGEHTYNRIWPPLSLANCAAILEKSGHDVRILDAHALRIKPHKIAGHVRGFDKVFITSSSLDRWQCPNVNMAVFYESAAAISKVCDEFYVMGYHGTVDPQPVLEASGAKAVI